MTIVCTNRCETFAFREPLRSLRADVIEDVPETFAAAERALASGRYVAGYVTYEAGAAFVPRQTRPERGVLPFVHLGVYRAPVAAPPARGEFALGPLTPTISRERYRANLDDVLARIRAGDVYQVNLATPFTFGFAGDPYALFGELTEAAAYPYAAYVETEAQALVSCSPELFVRFERDRLVTKPMKGTASSEHTAELHGAKNRAEHVMIVDLLRNDMHRLNADVAVERLAEVEHYPAFATMTSTISARRARSFGFAETFAAMFPCGSVTGAPKMTAMRAIAERETPRDIFCGSIGYLGPDGSGTWNVAIRTAHIDRARGRGTLHVGGGIVADSSASDEWAEILVKRRFFDRLAPPYALLETMRRDFDGRYHELDAHLARLRASANDLHFDFDEARVRAALDAACERDVLVRVCLESDGTIALSTRPMYDAANATVVWSSRIVDPREPLQRHKTTWRPHYDAAREEARAASAFDALLRTADGYVADGARTNLFIDFGDGSPLATPPVSDGALPGILRARYLHAGRAIERRLTTNDVESAAKLYLGNSARGLKGVTLVVR